jgi:caspase domain-containing protein
MDRRLSLILAFFIAQLVLLAQVDASFADKRIALVIGNSHYKNTSTLPNPVNDAADVAQALTAVGFDVSLKIDAGKRDIDQALAQFARDSSRADAALFYYAGHGMQYHGVNYLMPVDAELQDEISLRYELTTLDEVKESLQRSSGVKIMILDACRTNPIADKFVRSISVSTRDIPKVQGYARPEQVRGMIIVYATQADDVANDGKGRNSPFSSAFIREIKEPGLEIGAMFRRVSADVNEATNGKQAPEVSISLLSDYYLNQSETDQQIWARIRTTADLAAIREFLARYPNSFYAPDAAARLELLERESREKDPADQSAQQQRDVALTEMERLRIERAERERMAAEARAQAEDLAAKLANAEAERKKLAAELAERRSQSDAEKADGEREATRAQELRAQIAALEQRAVQAQANVAAEDQKVKQASDAAGAAEKKVALVETSGVAATSAAGGAETALVPQIRDELLRLGCYAGGDQEWSAADMKRGLAKYALYAKLESPPQSPSTALLEDLKGRRDRLCPADCSAREIAVGGRCVPKTCAHGEALNHTGQCVAKAVQPHEIATHSAAPRPTASGHCFVFNGNHYCE